MRRVLPQLSVFELPKKTLCIYILFIRKKVKKTDVIHEEEKNLIQIKSVTNSCICPKCGCVTDKYHGTYIRKVQDLPILGKSVQLEINAHEYD